MADKARTDSQGERDTIVTTDALPIPDQVESPCVRICTLDEKQICVGCGRSLDEIAVWSRMSREEKRAVCAIAIKRMADRVISQDL